MVLLAFFSFNGSMHLFIICNLSNYSKQLIITAGDEKSRATLHWKGIWLLKLWCEYRIVVILLDHGTISYSPDATLYLYSISQGNWKIHMFSSCYLHLALCLAGGWKQGNLIRWSDSLAQRHQFPPSTTYDFQRTILTECCAIVWCWYLNHLH